MSLNYNASVVLAYPFAKELLYIREEQTNRCVNSDCTAYMKPHPNEIRVCPYCSKDLGLILISGYTSLAQRLARSKGIDPKELLEDLVNDGVLIKITSGEEDANPDTIEYGVGVPVCESYDFSRCSPHVYPIQATPELIATVKRMAKGMDIETITEPQLFLTTSIF
jgi:hypothetical protein